MVVLGGCGIYSFSDVGGIPPEVETIAIKDIPNHATTINPSLSQELTQMLRDRFVAQTNLELRDMNADWELEGEIVGYQTAPVAAGPEQAALNRLTITVRMKFTDHINKANSWESSFSRFEDFSAGQNLSDVEQQLTAEINDQLVNDIFNKVAVNW